MEVIEKRYLDESEVRVKEGSRKVKGRGIVFNSWSKDLGGFRERIRPQAVEGVLNDPDIIAAFNHNPEKIMGRTGAGTLKLEVTTRGVNYEFDAPNTTAGNDLLENLARKDVKGSSFVFRIAQGGQEWKEGEDGIMERTITKFAEVREMGPVVGEAYDDTKVALRSLQEWKKEHTPDPEPEPELIQFDEVKHDLRKKQLTI